MPATTDQLLNQVGAVDGLIKDVLDMLDDGSSSLHPGALTMDQGLREAVRAKMTEALRITGEILPG
jgi:hypothetical protein